jgi:hypothetical protein
MVEASRGKEKEMAGSGIFKARASGFQMTSSSL